MKRIFLAADHAGVDLKLELFNHLQQQGYKCVDLGGFDAKAKDCYPEIADKLVNQVLSNKDALGVLLCGTGVGVSMRANRYMGIRAALVHSKQTAQSAKQHNNANVLCMGGRVISIDTAKNILNTFLQTEFEGERHISRLQELDSPVKR